MGKIGITSLKITSHWWKLTGQGTSSFSGLKLLLRYVMYIVSGISHTLSHSYSHWVCVWCVCVSLPSACIWIQTSQLYLKPVVPNLEYMYPQGYFQGIWGENNDGKRQAHITMPCWVVIVMVQFMEIACQEVCKWKNVGSHCLWWRAIVHLLYSGERS